jgi:DNA-binding transcriptional MerR regulator
MSTDVSTGMRSAQVARAAGVNQQTLRYYERRGLLAEPDRSPGGHRLYPPEAVTVVRVIKAAQRLGFSLDEVTDLLKTGRHSASVGRRPLVIGGAMSGTRFFVSRRGTTASASRGAARAESLWARSYRCRPASSCCRQDCRDRCPYR